MKGVMTIFGLEEPRLTIALDQLVVGLGFVYEDVWFLKRQNTLRCQAISPLPREQLSESAAKEAIEHARSMFDRLNDSSAFRRAIAELIVLFSVVDDYGMGTVTLCELVDDRLVWRL